VVTTSYQSRWPAFTFYFNLLPHVLIPLRLKSVPFLLNALCSAEPQQQYPTPEKKQRALKKALDYIKTFSNSPITLNELAQETQVSARTLQYAFLNHFGLSPKAYLQMQRLNNVHKELFTSSTTDTTVADVAHRQGFWHMGQFAADYKRLFGRLPSATLKNS
jgi:AraC family ethanolamine operon transcriptional activator